MPAFRPGKVLEVFETTDDLVRARVDVDGGSADAFGFPRMVGPVATGDRVILNTTGIELGLGTGGMAFILWDLDGPGPANELNGHIMKLRYTPWQTEVVSVEAPESEHHDAMTTVEDIDGMPVVSCTLHSQVAGIAAGIKAVRPDARVGYLMTDGASLPLAWSDLLRQLRTTGLVDVTCTSGHAFGGDLEAVTIFSGLAALRTVANCDVVIAGMGPGVVGTSTVLGHTALEQGHLLDATTALGGRPVACVRMSYADERVRHRGISHHTLTALRLATHTRVTVVIPSLEAGKSEAMQAQLTGAGIPDKHDVVTADGRPAVQLMTERQIRPSSMGRAFEQVPELFLAAGAAGAHAASSLGVA